MGALKQWAQEYFEIPDDARLGVCCSGGGIRSASYCLGALQVLDHAGLLPRAEYLAAVSGGDYIAAARSSVIGATWGDFGGDDGGAGPSFADVPPFAPNSPEERHLRDNSSYLARGLAGKFWLGMNVLYGAIRHMVPFVAGLFLIAATLGFAFNRWLGPVLNDTTKSMDWRFVDWNLLLAAALAVLGGFSLLCRQIVQQRGHPSGAALAVFQGLTMLLFRMALLVGLLLAGLPAALWALSRAKDLLLSVGVPTLSAGTLFSAGVAYLTNRSKRLKLLRVLHLLLPFASLIVVGIPFVGFTYWVAQQGFHVWWSGQGEAGPFIALCVAVADIAVVRYLDEVTPSMHLFYRERLAKAFVGRRTRPGDRLDFEELPWSLPLSMSKLQDHDPPGARPKLVVCAAVNASDDSIPLGRNAAPFTFERDYSGSPVTGYIPTSVLESAAGEGVLTLPAMMAISGAALSPSMGKMTRSSLRMLMAIFNVRLGVWLPNPTSPPDVRDDLRLPNLRTPAAVRQARDLWTNYRANPGWKPMGRSKRPGPLYSLREALGRNSLGYRFVYVTDGGHFDNLGLVELLRRGCGQIVCLDAAGDDLDHFHTLSEAIALARADLGVEITIDTTPLKPVDGESPSDHVCGSILFPDGREGVLVFAKAAMARDAPQDAKAFRDVDPRFPTHSTADQFFDERTFEAYRGLGGHAARHCVNTLNEYRTNQGQEPFRFETLSEPPCPEPPSPGPPATGAADG